MTTKVFTPDQLEQITDTITDTLNAVDVETLEQGAIVCRDRLRKIEGFLCQFARNFDAQGLYEWRVGILWKLRDAFNAEDWLEYRQAIAQCLDVASTLPTGVDLEAMEDEPELVYSCECA